mmetsp:Transcript_88255/g.250113  ORF Transcript_88255/g.250113 Transcript_88255/m.250113 type:complete len:200 (+) Transcript_88255:803-1402(+)
MLAPGVTAVSIVARRVPFFVKTLILPSASPATKYLEPPCEPMASAVMRGASPSLPAGTCISRWSWAVTLTEDPRYWETFSSVDFRRDCFSSFVRRRCRTWALYTRMAPPASPVAMRYSSCEGETARCVTGCSWPAANVSTSSPAGVKSRTEPSALAATRSVEGMACCVFVEDEDRGFRSGRKLTRITGSSWGITAFERR